MSSAQDRLDQIRATSGQRWVLALIAVAAPVIACIATGAASGSNPTAVAIVAALLAIVSSVRPDTHLGMFVACAVVWFWLAKVTDVTTPWSMVAAVSLFVFHAATALMGLGPAGMNLDRTIIRRWLLRSGAVTASTSAVWAIVVLLDHRQASGSALLTLAALVTMITATLVIRARSVPSR
jgi:hypothetical protein